MEEEWIFELSNRATALGGSGGEGTGRFAGAAAVLKDFVLDDPP